MDLIQQLWLLKQSYSSGSYYDSEQDLHLHHIPASLTESDLDALREHGHVPNQMFRPEHDKTLKELQVLTETWSLEEAAAAFVAGLWSAPFYWQSALTGKLIATVMPEHPYTPYSGSTHVCTICGFHNRAVDTTFSWYQSFLSGTPLDGEPVGHVFALQEMANADKRPAPTEYDRWTFRAILTVLRNLSPKTRYSKVREALQKENLLPTKSKWVYGSLLEALGLIGVLDTKDHPGMATAFTTYIQRDQRPNSRVEVQAPLAWWDSSVGINEETLQKVFFAFDCSSVSLTNRPQPQPSIEKTITGALEKKRPSGVKIPKASSAAGKGPVEAGDVYAIRIRDGVWVTVYCHKVEMAHTLVAKIEFLDGVFDNMPAPVELIPAFRGRKDGRWQQWTASIDSTSWVRRIVRNFPAPGTNEPEPDRIPGGGAKDLKFLADWCFPEIK